MKWFYGINYIQIDESNVEELITDLQTPAFGYEKKLIIVKNSGLLKKEGKRVNAKLKELKENVSEYISKNLEEIIEKSLWPWIRQSTLEKTWKVRSINENFWYVELYQN